jgi:hypothetical protein
MFGSNKNFTGLSGMLGSSGSNNYGFNPNQSDTDSLFKNLGINTVKAPVQTVKKTAGNLGLGITFGGSARRDIKKDNKAGNIVDPVQYTLNLINKAKTQNMSNSQQWVNQPANPANPNYTGTTPQRLPLGTSMVQPYVTPKQNQSLIKSTNPLFMDLGMIQGVNPPDDFSSFFGGNGQQQEIPYGDQMLGGDTGTGEFDEWDSSSYAGGDDSGTGTYSGAYDNSRSTNPNAIDAYAEDWMSDYNTGNVPTAEELRASGINLNKLRNAIATGMIDPYNLGVGSNIPFTYDQLKGIEGGLAKSMDPAITDIQARIATADKAASNSSSNSNQMIDNERALLTAFNNSPIVKEYNAAKQAYQMIGSISSVSKNPAQHQALITKYAKFLDPTSVVRESEFAITKKYSQSKLNQISKEIQHAMNGTGVLSKDAIEAIQGATKELFNSYAGNYESLKKQYEGLAARQGMNPENVTFDYSGGLDNMGGSSGSSGSSGLSPEIKTQLQQALSSGKITQDEYNYATGNFKSVGGGTKSASNVSSLQDAMRRIARNESDGSGGYKAVGPKITNPKSQYYGQRAIGKYQVMQGNIGPWSKEVLGRSVTPTEFYNNPALQDKIVAGKMMQIYNDKTKGNGNWADVASVWFTGGPRSTGANKKDVLGTSGAQYVNKFLS